MRTKTKTLPCQCQRSKLDMVFDISKTVIEFNHFEYWAQRYARNQIVRLARHYDVPTTREGTC
jgi:hypothetical protein